MLSVEDLHVAYGPITALRGVSLSVKRGEIVSAVGPNGAGKSTLMHAITGVVRCRKGSIAFEGQSIVGNKIEQVVNAGISLVPEGRQIFSSLTVAENLSLGATPRSDAGGVARDLERILEYFPVLAERLSGMAGKLSGGEQQQLAIARALLAKPKLMLLDEPSLGLGPKVIDLVYEIITRLREEEGLTILMVEQNAARALSIADRTYVINTGQIVLTGRSEELHQNEEFENAYFGFYKAAGDDG